MGSTTAERVSLLVSSIFRPAALSAARSCFGEAKLSFGARSSSRSSVASRFLLASWVERHCSSRARSTLDTAQADIGDQGNQRHLDACHPRQVYSLGAVAMFVSWVGKLLLEYLLETVEVGYIVAAIFELLLCQEHTTPVGPAELFREVDTQVTLHDRAEIVGIPQIEGD